LNSELRPASVNLTIVYIQPTIDSASIIITASRWNAISVGRS